MNKPIVFYSWDAITKKCKFDLHKIYEIIKKGDLKKFPGPSFLLNPGPLQTLPGIYQRDIVEYVAIASLRNYFDAHYLHNVSLPKLFVDQAHIEAINRNRLLNIVGNEIKFKFEEEYGNQVW